MKKILLLNFVVVSLLLLYYITKGFLDNNHLYVYPLDDTYIHLSMAKHVCFDHTWGITKYTFSSTSSSPLYTVLLSICMFIGGINDYYPLILNFIFTFGILYLIFIYLKHSNKPLLYLFSSLIIIFFTPLHVQSISGMEHSLHILGVVYSLYFFQQAISSHFLHKKSFYLYLSLFVFSLARYENMFLIISMSFMVFCLGDLKKAAMIFMFGMLPIIGFGYYSIQEGGFFFPNSLIAKSLSLQVEGNYLTHIKILIEKFVVVFNANRQFRFLGYLLILSFLFNINTKDIRATFLASASRLIVFATYILHILFAGFGWLYRYESYVIVAACLVVCPFVFESFQLFKLKEYFIQKKYFPILRNISMIICFFYFGNYSFFRLLESHETLQYASQNIYHQQIQMARFLKKNYVNEYIAANDIGAITYYSDIHLTDLVGLGSNDVLKAKLNHQSYSVANSNIAIIYDSWFQHLIPSGATKVATWKIPNNVICGSETVTFYAIRSQYQAQLKANLLAFQQELPKSVECFYF